MSNDTVSRREWLDVVIGMCTYVECTDHKLHYRDPLRDVVHEQVKQEVHHKLGAWVTEEQACKSTSIPS